MISYFEFKEEPWQSLGLVGAKLELKYAARDRWKGKDDTEEMIKLFHKNNKSY